MSHKRRMLLVALFLLPIIFVFSECFFNGTNRSIDPRGENYAGSKACISCHKELYQDYRHSAHYFSTRQTDSSNIHGDFESNKRIFRFSQDLKVAMEKHDDGLYQYVYFKGRRIKAGRFDITFGGRKAETYLSWNGNQIFELPVSYFLSIGQWTGSPGYDTVNVKFVRNIGSRCFECHSSYIKELPMLTQSITKQNVNFDKASLILSIDCERCHGPAADHVNWQSEHPGNKTAKFITTYSSLSKNQRVEMCAQCHSGIQTSTLASMFQYKPGDPLEKFQEQPLFPVPINEAKLDVHGNQDEMLESSKCFLQSKMDCATCHSNHGNPDVGLAIYSNKCINCHKDAVHDFGKAAVPFGTVIRNNCIDCHMPLIASGNIAVETAGKMISNLYTVRSHHIAVYPKISAAFLMHLPKPGNYSKKRR